MGCSTWIANVGFRTIGDGDGGASAAKTGPATSVNASAIRLKQFVMLILQRMYHGST